MSNLNIDYSKDNEFLPQNIRAFLSQDNRVVVQTFDAYFTLFDSANKYVLLNNWVAAKFASGFTRMNYMTLRSGVAPRLLKIKCDKTVGKLFYQAPEDSEKKVDEILPKDYLSKMIYEAFDKAYRTGRCLIGLYKSAEDEKPYLRCYDAFRHEIDFDKEGNIAEARMFLIVMEDIATNFAKYFIIEKRYYKDGKPYQKMVLRYQRYNSEKANRIEADVLEVETKDIPKWLKDKFKDIKFNSEQELESYIDLGVYHIDSSAVNSKFPDSKIPEAMFVDAVDTLVMTDQSLTDKEVEKHLARAQVLVPEFGKEYMPNVYGALPQNQSAVAPAISFGQNVKNPLIAKYPTKSMEESKPQNVQFDFRPEQWAYSINEDICRLCAIVGIGVIDYDSRLLGGSSQRTDDEINAMTDITRQTVEASRNLNEPEINKLLACLSALYELPSPVKIRWSMATIINPSKNALRITQLYNAQLISKKQALKELYPDLMENEIDDLYKEIEQETSYNPEKEILKDYDNF